MEKTKLKSKRKLRIGNDKLRQIEVVRKNLEREFPKELTKSQERLVKDIGSGRRVSELTPKLTPTPVPASIRDKEKVREKASKRMKDLWALQKSNKAKALIVAKDRWAVSNAEKMTPQQLSKGINRFDKLIELAKTKHKNELHRKVKESIANFEFPDEVKKDIKYRLGLGLSPEQKVSKISAWKQKLDSKRQMKDTDLHYWHAMDTSEKEILGKPLERQIDNIMSEKKAEYDAREYARQIKELKTAQEKQFLQQYPGMASLRESRAKNQRMIGLIRSGVSYPDVLKQGHTLSFEEYNLLKQKTKKKIKKKRKRRKKVPEEIVINLHPNNVEKIFTKWGERSVRLKPSKVYKRKVKGKSGWFGQPKRHSDAARKGVKRRR